MSTPPMARAEDPAWTASLIETLMGVADADGVSAMTLAHAWREARARVSFLRDVEVRRPQDCGPRDAVEAWMSAGQVIVLEHRDMQLLPMFQFAADGRPHAEVSECLRVLDRSGWSAALWFRRRCEYLDDARPHDVLPRDPARVVEAARREAADLIAAV